MSEAHCTPYMAHLGATIILDKNPRFLSRFWVSLSKALGIKLHPSTATN